MTESTQSTHLADNRDAGDDAGLITADLAVAITFILLPLIMFLTAVVQWPERQGLATIAAAEGARSAALADSPAEAGAAMNARVREVLDGSGQQDLRARAVIGGTFAPGDHIEVTVVIELPTIAVPGIATLASRSYQATSFERIEPHRVIEP